MRVLMAAYYGTLGMLWLFSVVGVAVVIATAIDALGVSVWTVATIAVPVACWALLAGLIYQSDEIAARRTGQEGRDDER